MGRQSAKNSGQKFLHYDGDKVHLVRVGSDGEHRFGSPIAKGVGTVAMATKAAAAKGITTRGSWRTDSNGNRVRTVE